MSIKFNDDKELVDDILRQLKINNGYCPCRITKTPDTKCMCKEFLDMSDGICHCGLYVKTND